LALLAAASGLVCASVPAVQAASLPVAGLGLLLSLAGIVYAVGREKGLALSVLAGVVSLATMVIMVAMPWLLDPQRQFDTASPPPGPERSVAPLSTRGGTARELDPSGWVDASSEAAQWHDTWVRVVSASIERVGLESGNRRYLTEDSYLVIRVQLANNGVDRAIEYKSWREWLAAQRVVLTDSNGKVLAPARFPADKQPVGAIAGGRIFPGKWLDDFLIFEPPQGTFAYLDLELPAEAFGNSGKLRFRLPRSMIRVRTSP
jgi:hypothetical protein